MSAIELLGSDVGRDELAEVQALLDDGAWEAPSLDALAWVEVTVQEIGGAL